MSSLFLLLDIGTTTVSGAIVNAKSGKTLAESLLLNEQARYGDDVITRIGFALKSNANKNLLQKAVASTAKRLTKQLLSQAKRRPSDIAKVFCVCNAAIHHLVLGIDPSSLITPPYRPAEKDEISVASETIGMKLSKDCVATFLPNMGGFVGSDALAVIMATGIYKSKDISLAIDIGTNGEIVLGNKKRLLVASTAAGPAFEGRHIKCGMPAIKGAIEKINIESEKTDIKVIGGAPPKGISGSGLIDAVFGMLKNNIMNKSGRINESEYVVYKKRKTKIAVTQADIRKIQLAKAAIYAGVKTLLRTCDAEQEDIKHIFITGSFGNTISLESVTGIGLIPSIEKAAVNFLKNGPLQGLKLYVTKPRLRKEMALVLKRAKHIPLFGRDFNQEFTSSLSF